MFIGISWRASFAAGITGCFSNFPCNAVLHFNSVTYFLNYVSNSYNLSSDIEKALISNEILISGFKHSIKRASHSSYAMFILLIYCDMSVETKIGKSAETVVARERVCKHSS